MRRTFINTLEELAKKDTRIYLLTLDVGYGVLEHFKESFPERFINAGIAEQNAVSFATGMAIKGKIPFIYSINSFLAFRGYEQIRECAHMGAKVIMAGVGLGDEYENYGISHDSSGDIEALNAIKNLKILTPKNREEVRAGILKAYSGNGTYYLRLSRFGELKK